VLNLDAALQSTVTALPTSLTFWSAQEPGRAATGNYDQFAVTNIGKTPPRIRSQRSLRRGAGAAVFRYSGDDNATSTLALTIEPGQTRTAYAYWTANRPWCRAVPRSDSDSRTREFGTGALLYGGQRDTRDLILLNPPPSSARAGSLINVYARVIDETGYPITVTKAWIQGTATAGGGTVTLSPRCLSRTSGYSIPPGTKRGS